MTAPGMRCRRAHPERAAIVAELLYFLPHSRPHCTGDWKIIAYSGHVLWNCAGCWATFPDCTSVREAATRENLSGEQIQRLTHEGQRFIRDMGGEC